MDTNEISKGGIVALDSTADDVYRTLRDYQNIRDEETKKEVMMHLEKVCISDALSEWKCAETWKTPENLNSAGKVCAEAIICNTVFLEEMSRLIADSTDSGFIADIRLKAKEIGREAFRIFCLDGNQGNLGILKIAGSMWIYCKVIDALWYDTSHEWRKKRKADESLDIQFSPTDAQINYWKQTAR